MTNSTTQSGEPGMIPASKHETGHRHQVVKPFQNHFLQSTAVTVAILWLAAAQAFADGSQPRLFIQQQNSQPPRPVSPPANSATLDPVVDVPYEVKSLAELQIKAEIREPDVDDGGKPILKPTYHKTLPSTHYSATPEMFTRPDGSWVDQRLTGPVAPFEFLPTYFSDNSQERFGHSRGFLADSALSVVHFYGTVPVLPFKMTQQSPWQPVYPNYFPPPISLRGKVRQYSGQINVKSISIESAAIAAMFLLFP